MDWGTVGSVAAVITLLVVLWQERQRVVHQPEVRFRGGKHFAEESEIRLVNEGDATARDVHFLPRDGVRLPGGSRGVVQATVADGAMLRVEVESVHAEGWFELAYRLPGRKVRYEHTWFAVTPRSAAERERRRQSRRGRVRRLIAATVHGRRVGPGGSLSIVRGIEPW